MIKIYIGDSSLKLLDEKMKTFSSRMNSKTASAINKAARHTRDQMMGAVTRTYNISKRNVNKKKVFYQSKKARATALSARVTLKETKRIGVEYFAARQTSQGTTFALMKGGSRTLITGAFMGARVGKKAPKLHGGVFIRQAGAKRLPINKLYAMSPWGMYSSKRHGNERKSTVFAGNLMNKYINSSLKELARTL